MTISNKITISRIVLVPVMILMIYIPPLRKIDTIFNLDLGELLFAILFVIASFTDFLDGHLARKRNEITTFGKFLDPIADKVLVLSGLLYIITYKTEYKWWWILVVIVLFREFSVSALRMIAAKEDVVIAAGFSGKLKTVVLMIAMIMILFNNFGLDYLMNGNAHYVSDVLLYMGVLLTAYSGFDYVYRNRNAIKINE
ncbi:MAG: CDP-diacylglycerol--glycerol-3-phosphate 3-phosphatidyltransferase [Acholeplasmataceae bacterium]|jgi:CDP-diacylglycerol--glycerol-3-phosphate 3-phosphatidyltransferase|nr:CDP-diacylglycerol--glycerol-3-phosphate 3-phosphatidyltransferase [Acholeplasmataceae bacterium]